MRIARIEAIAFGAIGGRRLEPGPGLTIVHGPNESGKSSTMHLIRGVLFGFPPLRRDGDGPLREPKGGGQRSGRIDVIADDGRRVIIERTHGSSVRVADADGTPIGEAALAALGLANADLFDRVQTFDARDLAWMGLLDDPAVRAGVLASAVLGGGGAGAAPVIDALGKRADALYRRSGENQPYAVRLRHLTAMRKALRERQRAIAAQTTGDDPVAAAEQQVEAAATALAERTASVQRLRRTLEVRAAVLVADRLDASPPPLPEGDDDPAAISALRALLGEVPTAVEARRRAAELRVDADRERARAAEARARLDVDGVELTLTDEAALRAAADAVRETAREATRAEDVARTLAQTREAEEPAAAPRVGLGSGIAAAGLIAAVLGAVTSTAALTLAGVVAIAAGFIVLRGWVAAATSAPVPIDAGRETARAAAADADAAARAATAAWAEALRLRGLPEAVRPEQLDDVLGLLATARQADEQAAAAAARATAADEQAAEIAERATAALAAVGEQAPADLAGLASAVDQALERLEADRQRRADLRLAREAWEAERGRAREEVSRLAQGDAALVEDARGLDPDQAAATLDVADDEIAVLEEDHRRAVEALGGARSLRAAAEQDADVVVAAQAVEDAAEDFRAVADRWLTVALAQTVATRARDRFVERHQPGVFARAARHIAAATGGAWTDIRMPDGERAGARSEVIGRDGERTPFAELSEGTVGLVYLCLRAGLVDEMRDEGGPALPVLMDDVLTHLDPERRAGGARVIADLATRHQVLYFTCHPEQVQALVDASAEAGAVLDELPLERLV